MNIGILQPAGIAGKIIETAFADPECGEVFTPVIYSKENGNEKNVSHDLKFGNIDAIVVAPGSSKEFAFGGAMTVYVDERLRLTIMPPEADEAMPLDAVALEEAIKKAWSVVRRDFLVSLPRVAVIAPDSDHDRETADDTIQQLAAEGIGVYGPYPLTEYVERQQHRHFDITLCTDEAQAQTLLNALTEPTRARYLAAIPMVMAQTDFSADYPFDADDLEAPAQALRGAIYTAMEVSRNRRAFDEAHADPLLKLYHERRDDSEKVRFSVARKRPQ